jgi:hypothetical protein
MRKLLFTLAVIVPGLGASAMPAAAAQSYPWCARYSTTGGECSFNTFEQCMETLSGIGGSCVDNPGYTGPAANGSYAAAPRNGARHPRPRH